MKHRTITAGSRGSRLAVIQSEYVMRRLKDMYPAATTELVTLKTTGDRILDRPLDQIGGKGLFARELDEALVSGKVDMTVHSLKDLPQQIPDEIPVCSYTVREDPRDVLILPEGRDTLDLSRPIGTTSLRRSLQIRKLYPGASTESVRGNVETRLKKLDEGDYSALILAAAGIRRLGLEHRISRYFEPDEMIPASGQGILAVQARAGDEELIEMLRCAVNDSIAEKCAIAERAFIRTIGAGCGSPDTAYSYIEDGQIHISGFRYDASQGKMIYETITGDCSDAELMGIELARRLLEK